MVEDDDRARPDESRQMHIEMAKVADEHYARRPLVSGPPPELPPGAQEAERERQRDRRTTQSGNAGLCAVAKRHVALVHVMTECRQPFDEDADARMPRPIVRAEAENRH